MAFLRPMSGAITQDFGPTDFTMEPSLTWHGTFYTHFHEGIDISGPIGQPVYAAQNGYVQEAGWETSLAIGGGNSIRLRHSPSLNSIYAHLSQILVSVGQQVVTGQKIGLCGDTGNVTGPHLHFGVWVNDPTWGFTVDDPNLYINGTVPTASSEDIPTINPLSGTLVKMALCQPTNDGRYAPPSSASAIARVYYDRLLVSPTQYSVTDNGSGDLFIVPTTSLPIEVEVRADYIA